MRACCQEAPLSSLTSTLAMPPLPANALPRTAMVIPGLNAVQTGFNPGMTIAVRGNAFAGNGGIASVEVSDDNGASWQQARIDYAGTAKIGRAPSRERG